MYTTLKTAKQLKEWGCELESEMEYAIDITHGELIGLHKKGRDGMYEEYIPAYDILNDICVKYAKEFFGNRACNCADEYEKCHCGNYPKWSELFSEIMFLLQQGKQKEAEDYFLEHTIFNPKNK